MVTDVTALPMCRSSVAMQASKLPPSQQNMLDSVSRTSVTDLPDHLLAQLLDRVASPLQVCKAFTCLAKDPYFKLRRAARRFKNLFPAAVASDDGLLTIARDLLAVEGGELQAAQRAHYLPYFKAQLCIFIEQAARTWRMQELEYGLRLAQDNSIKQLPITPSMAAAYGIASGQGRGGLCGLLQELGVPGEHQTSASNCRYGSLQDTNSTPSNTCSWH
jgi:hypothetical protein